MIWKSASTVHEELGASLIPSYNTSKEKKKLFKAFSEHSGLTLGLFCGLTWNLNYNTFTECLPQSPSLELDLFPFLWYDICRIKGEAIRGLKAPVLTCLVLVSLLSDTGNQKWCREPEPLLVLMRHKYQLCGMWCIHYAIIQLLSLSDF